MSGIIVSDASCLIGLDNIGKLEILSLLYSKILIPPAVQVEFGSGPAFAKVVEPKDTNLVISLSLMLGLGESEAIALAVEQELPVILDDKRARNIASSFGLKIIGTVGILMMAKNSRIITSLGDTLEDLEMEGFYIHSAIKEKALKLSGEIQ